MNGGARRKMLASSPRRSSQMQNVNTLVSRRVPFGTAAVSGLLAFVAGIAIAAATPVLIGGLTAGHSSNATVSAPAAGAEQVAHNRSELGLGASSSVGAEQINHDRSEGGMSR